MAIQSSIRGALKVSGNPDSVCVAVNSFSELISLISQYLTVDISNQTFSNVVISPQQPGQADRDKIWWRISNAGSFVGIYAYANGVWSQIFPAPNEIFWLYGSSDDPPAGFKFVEASDGIFTGPQYAELIAKAIPTGGPAPYVYYPAIYVGL